MAGVVLCQLMNEVEGKHKRIPAKKVSKSSQKFSQMGNINLFLRACREFGLTEHSCFSTVDLHEQKNMMAVLVRALADRAYYIPHRKRVSRRNNTK